MKLTTWIILIIAVTSSLIYFQSNALANTAKKDVASAALVSKKVDLININKADAKTLSSLPGLGPKKAEAIVDYRKRNGNFASVEELVNVKGIGEKMMQRLSVLVTV